MEELIRPIQETAEEGARAQTELMIKAFSHDLVASIREFGLKDTREALPRMLRGP